MKEVTRHPHGWLHDYIMESCPPSWVRHFVSWRMLGWINDHSGVCWANVVWWKAGYDGKTWFDVIGCEDEQGSCYCGKYDAG